MPVFIIVSFCLTESSVEDLVWSFKLGRKSIVRFIFVLYNKTSICLCSYSDGLERKIPDHPVDK